LLQVFTFKKRYNAISYVNAIYVAFKDNSVWCQHEQEREARCQGDHVLLTKAKRRQRAKSVVDRAFKVLSRAVTALEKEGYAVFTKKISFSGLDGHSLFVLLNIVEKGVRVGFYA
jgi:hypothetical protein